jgi:hypothetical protein
MSYILVGEMTLKNIKNKVLLNKYCFMNVLQ